MTNDGRSTPAGWYADPEDQRGLRWWDGAQWTTLARPLDAELSSDRSASPPPAPATAIAAERTAIRPALPEHDRATTATVDRPPPRIWWIAAAALIVVAGAISAVIALAGDPSDDDSASSIVDDATSTTDPASTSEPEPTTTELNTAEPTVGPTAPTVAPPPPPPTAPPTVPATTFAGSVRRTCGADNSGDCYVAVRTGPTSDTAEVARRSEGTAVIVTCQTNGESVRGSVLGAPTSVWVRDIDGHYMSAAFLDVPGWSPFTVSMPC